jgi:hypothetical protein
MSNMPLDYSGSSCERGVFFLSTMWYGLMGVLVNSKVHTLGFSYKVPQFV